MQGRTKTYGGAPKRSRRKTNDKRPYESSIHKHRHRHGPAGRDGHRRGRGQRRGQLSQLGPRIESRTAPRHPLDRRRRHPRRHAHVERHDGGGAQRRLLSRTILLPGDHDALSGHDAGQHPAAGHLQHPRTAHLDHRVDGIRTAGRGSRRGTLPHLGRSGRFGFGPLAVHQHRKGDGHHRGHPALGGAGVRRRVALHVRFAAHLLVPLREGVPPLGRRMVRHFAGGHPLLRAVQGAEKFGADSDFGRRIRRRARARNAARLLGRGVGGALDFPAHAAQHHAHHHPHRHLRAGAGLRRQRSGELHRRAAGQLRRMADRPRNGQRVDHDGRTGQSGARQLPAAVAVGRGDGPDALLLEEIAPRHRNRAFARLAARGQRAVRLDLRIAQSGTRLARAQHHVDRADSRPHAESHRPTLRTAACRGAFVGATAAPPTT